MPSPIQRHPVDSSNVSSVGYHELTKTLAVEFKGGTVYHYDNVPADVHSNLMAAPSKGRFLREVVQRAFTHHKVT